MKRTTVCFGKFSTSLTEILKKIKGVGVAEKYMATQGQNVSPTPSPINSKPQEGGDFNSPS